MSFDPYKPPEIDGPSPPVAGGFRKVNVGIAASMLIGLSVGTDVLEIIAYFFGLLDDPLLPASIRAVKVVGGVARMGGVVTFLVWIHRVVSNAHAFEGGSKRHMRTSPGRAVGYWFIPGLNLLHGYRVVKDAWDASEHAGAKTNGDIILHWWLAYLASRIAAVATRFQWTPTSYAATGAFEAIAAVLVITVIVRLDERQRACARHMRSSLLDR